MYKNYKSKISMITWVYNKSQGQYIKCMYIPVQMTIGILFLRRANSMLYFSYFNDKLVCSCQ